MCAYSPHQSPEQASHFLGSSWTKYPDRKRGHTWKKSDAVLSKLRKNKFDLICLVVSLEIHLKISFIPAQRKKRNESIDAWNGQCYFIALSAQCREIRKMSLSTPVWRGTEISASVQDRDTPWNIKSPVSHFLYSLIDVFDSCTLKIFTLTTDFKHVLKSTPINL